MDEAEQTIARMAVEYWKLTRLVSRALAMVPEDRRERLVTSVRYGAARVEETLAARNISLQEFEGSDFVVNLPISPINSGDFPGEDALIVERTIEPAVICDTRVVLTGKVLLARKG
jgi:hypothetical protein